VVLVVVMFRKRPLTNIVYPVISIAIITFILIAMFLIRVSIEKSIMDVYSKTKDLKLIYIPQIINTAMICLMMIIVFDIYYVIHMNKWILNKFEWIVLMLMKYGFVIPIIILFYLAYYSIIDYVLTYLKHVVIDPLFFPATYSLLMLITALILLGLTACLYIGVKLQKYEKMSLKNKLTRAFKILWVTKGNFIVWIFMGYLIVNTMGFLVDALSTSMTALGVGRQLSQIVLFAGVNILVFASRVVNAIILYFFYDFFVKNYLESTYIDVYTIKE